MAAALLVLCLAALAVTDATGVTEVTDFVATVLRIRTPQGTLVVEVDDPNVRVSVEGDGDTITLSGAGAHEIRLTPGMHKVQATRDGKPLRSQWVTVTRDGKQVVRVSMGEAEATAQDAPLPAVIKLTVLDAKTAAASIRDLMKGKKLQVDVDERANRLLLRGTDDEIQEARELLVKVGETPKRSVFPKGSPTVAAPPSAGPQPAAGQAKAGAEAEAVLRPVVGIPLELDLKLEEGVEDQVQRFYRVDDLVTVPTVQYKTLTIEVNKDGKLSVGGRKLDLRLGEIQTEIAHHARVLLGDLKGKGTFDKIVVAIRVEQSPQYPVQLFRVIEYCQEAGLRKFLHPGHLPSPEPGGNGQGFAARFLRDFEWFDPSPPAGTIEHLTRLMQSMVLPESWQDAGGGGFMQYIGPPLERLAVRNHEKVHQAIGLVLETLRHPEALETPAWRRQIEESLDQIVSVDFRNATLSEVVDWVRTRSGAKVLLDQKAMDDAGIKPDATITLHLENVPLRTAIPRLLEQHEARMQYLLRDQALVLTSKEEADDYLEIQLYRMEPLLDRDAEGRPQLQRYGQQSGPAHPLLDRDAEGRPQLQRQTWVNLITRFVEPDTWDNAGGTGQIAFYEPKFLMIVLQTQPIHRQIASFLEEVQRQRAAGRRPAPADAQSR